MSSGSAYLLDSHALPRPQYGCSASSTTRASCPNRALPSPTCRGCCRPLPIASMKKPSAMQTVDDSHNVLHERLDGDGWFEIVSISGQYNHDNITGLFPAGESISGNSPFEGDNLIRVSDRNNPQPEAQLSGDGFQFSLDDGSFVMSFSHRSLRPLVILSFTAETLSRRERCCRLLKSTCGLKRNLMLLEQHTPVARW